MKIKLLCIGKTTDKTYVSKHGEVLKNQSMLYLYPYNQPIDQRYQAGKMKINVENLIKAYNHFFTTWYNAHNTLTLCYEDLLNNQDDVVRKLSNFLNYNITNTKFPELGKVKQSAHRYQNKKHIEYYKKQKPTQLTTDHMHMINTTLLPEIFNKLNYKKIGQ